jgi:glycosyl hydrolase family 113
VGTELAGVSGDRAHWLGVIKTVRDRYAGPLVYAATYTEYAKVGFWDAVDLIGIDAYWPLATQPTSDVAVLERAWLPIRTELATFAAKTKRRIVFTEAGYTSQRGTTTAPDSWTLSHEPDQVEQAAAYQALLASFDNQDWWAGVFWWVPKESSETQGLGYAIYGKAAEAVLRKWW